MDRLTTIQREGLRPTCRLSPSDTVKVMVRCAKAMSASRRSRVCVAARRQHQQTFMVRKVSAGGRRADLPAPLAERGVGGSRAGRCAARNSTCRRPAGHADQEKKEE
jgi:hypothetical protein